MPRILTVDDSRAIRVIVSKQMIELGFEVDEAEDGAAGLARLEANRYDLILLDVSMPVLDGPGMLAQLRERGDKTPVLMLTSEAKTSVVAGVMKLGIEDYILKPFKPQELRVKVHRALGLTQAPAAVAPPAPAAVPAEQRNAVDILVIDDMENVHKKLRALVPPHLSLESCLTTQAALAACRERTFAAVLVDADLLEVGDTTLVQLRALQPQAVCLALCLRSQNDLDKEARERGFDDILVKPFVAARVSEWLQQTFDNPALISVADNVLKVAGFAGEQDHLERYFQQLGARSERCLEQVAAACFEEAIVDVSALPPAAERAPLWMTQLGEQSKKMGLSLRVVGLAGAG